MSQPDMPVYIEVSLDGVSRGKMALSGITNNGLNLVAILGMIGTPGFVDIAVRATVVMAQRLGFDGAVAEAMTPAHDRLYRQAFRRIEGFSPITGDKGGTMGSKSSSSNTSKTQSSSS